METVPLYPRAFIEHLKVLKSEYNNESQKRDIINSLNTISGDIYSDATRFIYELLQNADDAAIDDENEVMILRDKEHLIVSHNGQPFSSDDVFSLTSVGESTKSSLIEKTGYKGIGFKSVFSRSEYVAVISGEYSFRFEKSFHSKPMPWQLIPIWTEIDEYQTRISNPQRLSSYSVNTIIHIKNSSEIFKALLELLSSHWVLLFLRKIKRIVVYDGEVKVVGIQKITENDVLSRVKILSDDGSQEEWITSFSEIEAPREILDSIKIDVNIPEKLRKVKKSSFTLAAKVNGGKIIPLKDGDSILFAYLPTKVKEIGLPFLINSDFITSASRESLHEDLTWNRWLLTECASGLLKWFAELSNTEYKSTMFSLIPSLSNSWDKKKSLSQLFHEELKEKAKSISFCPILDGSLISVNKLAVDATGITSCNIIDHIFLFHYLRRVSRQNEEILGLLQEGLLFFERLEPLGARIFKGNNIFDFATSPEFINGHKIPQNLAFIDFIKKVCETPAGSVLKGKLNNLPFIMDEKGILRRCNEIAYSIDPELFQFFEEFTLLHSEIQAGLEAKPELLKWLKDNGLKETSDQTYMTHVLLPDLTGKVNASNAIRIFKYLLELSINNDLTASDYQSLRRLPVMVKGSNDLKPAESCYLADLFEPELKLESKKLAISFVSEKYLTIDISKGAISSFLVRIGVKSNIWIEDVNESVKVLKNKYPVEWISYTEIEARNNPNGHYGFVDTNIIEFKDIAFSYLMKQRVDIAEMVWNYILIHSDTSNMITAKGMRRFGVGAYLNFAKYPVSNYFSWLIQHEPIVPTLKGDLKKIEDTFLNIPEITELGKGFLPIFFYQHEIPSSWRKQLNFKSTLELADLLYILDMISKSNSDGKSVSVTVMGQVDKIYEKILSFSRLLNADQKGHIKIWGENHSLPNKLKSFVPVDSLVSIPSALIGFGSDLANLIYLPSSIELSQEFTEEFCGLFGIRQFDQYKISFVNPHTDYEIKEEILKIIPYMVLLQNEQNPASVADNYLRLISEFSFIKVDSLSVDIVDEGVSIVNSNLNVFREDDCIYFSGRWNKVINITNISNEICTLLDLKELRPIFKDLLRMDNEERDEFAQTHNLDPISIGELYRQISFEHDLSFMNTDQGETKTTDVTEYFDLEVEPSFERLQQIKEETEKFFIPGEQKSFEEKLLELVNIPESQFEKGNIYHFTHITNAVDIIKSGKLLSRVKASENGFRNAASNHQIRISRDFVHDHVRFYFRPLTPTQYYNEGLGRQYGDEKPNCPVPVFFEIDLSHILEKYKGKIKISNGNLSSSWAKVGDTVDFLREFDFLNLYHQYPHPEFKRAAQQELIIPDVVDLSLVNYRVICRNTLDKETLLKLLAGHDLPEIEVKPNYYYNKNPYIEINNSGSNLKVRLIHGNGESVRLKLQFSGQECIASSLQGLIHHVEQNPETTLITVSLNSEYDTLTGSFVRWDAVSIFALDKNFEERLIYFGNHSNNKR